MKIYTIILVAILFAISIPAHAQEKTNTLEDQFTDVIDKSNRFEDYKVVKIYKLNNLRKNVKDSIAFIENNLQTAQSTIEKQKAEISALTNNVATLETNLSTSKSKEDGITLFGSLIKKSTYKTTMWAIIAGLILIAAFLFYRFNNSNSITKEANEKLSETESEFEGHRQRALEREQQLRRKLQDEINRSRKA